VEPLTLQPLLSRIGFVWRCPTPSGTEIRVSQPDSSVPAHDRRFPFYACSVNIIDKKRIFVFPPGARAEPLSDDEVSWFYQLKMSDLSEAERSREDDYRRERDLRFPLTHLPD
jgi:hypothetical protein